MNLLFVQSKFLLEICIGAKCNIQISASTNLEICVVYFSTASHCLKVNSKFLLEENEHFEKKVLLERKFSSSTIKKNWIIALSTFGPPYYGIMSITVHYTFSHSLKTFQPNQNNFVFLQLEVTMGCSLYSTQLAVVTFVLIVSPMITESTSVIPNGSTTNKTTIATTTNR